MAWRWSAASAACACAAVAWGAWVLSPPAVGIADQYLTLAALCAIVAVIAIVLTSWRQFERPQRLAAFVMLVATGMSWYASRLSVHERQFDYLVASQKTALRLQATQLSGDIVNFLRQRALSAPRYPRRPLGTATWPPCCSMKQKTSSCSTRCSDPKFAARASCSISRASRSAI